MPTIATTTPAAPPKLTRLDLAFAIYQTLRLEKTPPMGRYCVILALARHAMPMTSHQIAAAIGQDTAPSGTIDSAIRGGLVARGQPSPTGASTFLLTQLGEDTVARLIHPAIF